MAERLISCPKCNFNGVKILKEHNPETRDMNQRVTLGCRSCEHTWEGSMTSAYHQNKRRRGFRR